jgi:signal transduction histidine kinase
MDQVLVELVRGQYGPTRSIDPELLDSLLTVEFVEKGIYTPYMFGVLIAEEKLLTTAEDDREKEALLASSHRVSMSPGNIFTRPDELYVSFPQEKGYVLKSLWTLLSGSALFTLVIILGFSYTVHALFRQKKLSDIKTDFINNMTHEFKTPIATISLAVDAINNPRIIGDQARIAQYTGIIRDENKRMNAQVEKVLQMALLDRNEVKLNKERLDMHQIIQTAVEAMAIQIENNNGRIVTDLRAKKTAVSGDEVHLINVIQNLLDNANKYTPTDPLIRVETWNDKHGIFVSVADNGIGMDRETQRRIFEKFYRLPKGNVHDVKGFGLGLSYVKALLDAHNGSITVQSQLREGSRFIIYLPNAS